jgi:hypothetical protein
MHIGIYNFSFGDRGFRVLLADLQEHLTAQKLAEKIYNECRNELTVADLVIIRPQVDQPIPNPQTLISTLGPIFERVPKLPIYILSSNDFKHHLSNNIHPSAECIFPGTNLIELIAIIRQAELANIAHNSQAILTAQGATYFRAPSKTYCKRFLRAGNVQMHRGTLDVFFFWLLPWLKNCHALVSDTWTISSIALNSARLLARYDKNHGRCKVDMLSKYQDGSAAVEKTTNEILERVLHGCNGNALWIFSACMTGKSVERLKNLVRPHFHSSLSFQFLSLFNVEAGLSIQTLCDLHRFVEKDAFRHADLVPEGTPDSHIIDIDRTTYFPSVVTEAVVPLQKAIATEAKAFFERYPNSGAFFVHRNNYVSGQKVRHHAIYPDLSILLDNELFQNKLSEKLLSLETAPTVIIVPPHDAGLKLGTFAQTLLATRSIQPPDLFQHLDLNIDGSANPEDQRLRDRLVRLAHGDAVLILDDVSVTGERLSRYQKSLRNIEFKAQIHYLVGLARPERKKDWDRRVRDLRFRTTNPQHTVTAVEFLVLPDWDEHQCPWCAEQSLYRAIVLEHDVLLPEIARRNAELEQSNADSGKLNSIFFSHRIDDDFRLTPNSIFAHDAASQAEIFIAVASTIQQLRVHEDPTKNIGRHHYPILNCLDPGDYLGKTFTDTVLRAAILRAATNVELERVKGEDEAKRCADAKSLILSVRSDENSIAIELLLASALRKIPRITFSEQEKTALQTNKLDLILNSGLL